MTVAIGTKIKSKGKFLGTVLALVSGVTKDLTAAMSLTVGGVLMTRAAILAKLAGIQALFDDVATTHNAWQAAVKRKDDGAEEGKQFVADLKKAVESQFGPRSARLLDFGLSLPKARAPRTAAEKATSAGLGQQTRKVRGSKGKKQRLAVTVVGKPGVQLLGPDGKPLAGVEGLGAPVAPAQLSGAPSSSDGGSSGK